MADFSLEKLSSKLFADPLLLVILDGVGLYRGKNEGYAGNAFDLANTPNLDRLIKEAPISTEIAAHGPAVGLPAAGDMGNSEVGHNAMGAGQIYDQGAKLVNFAIKDGSMFKAQTWNRLVDQVKKNKSTFHLLGLLSDGNVHSNISQLFGLLDQLKKEQIPQIRLHVLADGRDVDPVSCHLYIEQLEAKLDELKAANIDAAIASGGGRMQITMDRYNADWGQVKRGWDIHVRALGRMFYSAKEAITILRSENPELIDQDLPGFVIADENSKPLGEITDGDSVVLFNFRGDRAIEISKAFDDKDFDKFDRVKVPDVIFAGLMEYDGDYHIPKNFLVPPPNITKTVSEYLAKNKIRQLAVSETQKFGHVTYFWNGNNSKKFDEELESWIEIKSDNVPFETTPAMKAPEVCQVILDELQMGKYKFIRVNFANGDMVGHTGVLSAAIEAMEVLDVCVAKLEQAILKAGGTMIITADHGNSDMMLEVNKKTGELKLDENKKPVIKTSHTLSPVPWLLIGKNADKYKLDPQTKNPGLANIAASLLILLGFKPPKEFLPSIIVERAD